MNTAIGLELLCIQALPFAASFSCRIRGSVEALTIGSLKVKLILASQEVLK